MQTTSVKYAPAEQQPPPPYQEMPPGSYPPTGSYPPPGSGPSPGSYPPPGSFAPPPNMIGGQSVTIVQPGVTTGGAMIIVGTPVGSKPTSVTCRSCHAQIISRVETRPTMRTHLIALLLCIFVCWPCVCVPYCMDSCNGVDHYCPNCNAFIGSYDN